MTTESAGALFFRAQKKKKKKTFPTESQSESQSTPTPTQRGNVTGLAREVASYALRRVGASDDQLEFWDTTKPALVELNGVSVSVNGEGGLYLWKVSSNQRRSTVGGTEGTVSLTGGGGGIQFRGSFMSGTNPILPTRGMTGTGSGHECYQSHVAEANPLT